MKILTMEEVESDIRAVLDYPQKECVVITRAGKASAVVLAIEPCDEEDLNLGVSPEFSRGFEERRCGLLPISEFEMRLSADTATRTVSATERSVAAGGNVVGSVFAIGDGARIRQGATMAEFFALPRELRMALIELSRDGYQGRS